MGLYSSEKPLHLNFLFPRSSNQATTKAASSQVQPATKMPSKPTAHKQRVASKDNNANIKIEGDANTKIDKPVEKAKESQPPIAKQSGELVASKVNI